MVAHIFPGQGSQVTGMGKELFDDFRFLTRRADEILGYSIRELCVNDPEKKLSRTEFTQPALFAVCSLSYLKYIEENAERPAFVAGHSVGEYSALFAAGVFDFETGLSLVKKRGELMATATGGGMAAVIGLAFDKVLKTLNDSGLSDVDIANLNTPQQVVISGPVDSVKKAKESLEKSGCKNFVHLPVSGAFHSRYMSDARKQFEEFLNGFTFYPPKVSVIANVTAQPYKTEIVAELLGSQINSSVKWADSVTYLLRQGVEKFQEIGPKRVLSPMVEAIRSAI